MSRRKEPRNGTVLVILPVRADASSAPEVYLWLTVALKTFDAAQNKKLAVTKCECYPDKKSCQKCFGDGIVKTYVNENARFDEAGIMFSAGDDPRPSRLPLSIDTVITMARHGRQSVALSGLRIFEAFTPTAIVTPDRTWHEQAVSDSEWKERAYVLMTKHPDSWSVLCWWRKET